MKIVCFAICVIVSALIGEGFCASHDAFWTAEDYFKAALVAYSTNANCDASIIRQRKIRKSDSNDCPRVEIQIGDKNHVRWIAIPGLRNVRDIGGWNGLRAGRVYRGSALQWMDCTNASFVAESPMAKDILVNRLGLRTELDLRGTKERKTSKTGAQLPALSEFGISPRYISLGGYMAAFTGTNSYRRALQMFANPENFPIYVHCAGGADRTGTVIFLLEALCGVPEWKLDIDYELTSMASVFGVRDRTSTTKLCYKTFKDTLKKQYVGETINEKVEDYCRKTLLLTNDEIRAIRGNL